ncbi:MAG: phenylalanine--tRNA ligase subunit beta [Candidatus Brocadiia bacterium]
MLTSYNWLKDYCAFDLRAHELAERLSHAGLNVETYEPHGDDWTLDVEVTSNRPDCLCHLGLAREAAALTGSVAVRPEFEYPVADLEEFGEVSSVEVTCPDLCPHYTARLIRGVTVGPSPEWLQQRLAVCGVRPVNNVVDITNYVMLECGQPLHAFDFKLLHGGRIIVRQARPGEIITTIDGTEAELSGEECVIADADHPVAVGGVMGGLESEINDATTEVLLEAARFAPVSIRRTSRRHGIASESSYRYERGVDPEITDWASRRACAMIADLAGGQILPGVGAVRTDETVTPEVTLRLPRLAMLLGLQVPREAVRSIFDGLGLETLKEDADSVTVRVPSWRGDLRREVDLIEEVARIHGYDRIRETTDMPIRAVGLSDAELVRRRARRLIAGAGFTEVVTRSLMKPDELQLSQPWTDADPIAVRNPTTAERTHLRLTCMANLLRARQFNQAQGADRADLFEMSRVYLPRQGEQLPEEKLCLTLLSDRDDGLRVLKGVLANLCDELGIEADVDEAPECAGPFRPEQALVLRLDGELLGVAGMLGDRFVEELDLRTRPALMELDFDLLTRHAHLIRPARPVPSYPAATRDLAVVVKEDVLWADIEQCVLTNAPETLESVEMFDVYRGEGVPDGSKSVAFSMTFRRRDGTITSEEAEQGRQAILSGLEQELGARLR